MKQTINEYQFRDAFMAIRPDNFSYEGLTALYGYLEQYENDTGTEMELDVIAICCDFAESTPSEIRQNYSIDKNIDLIEYLADRTTVIEIDRSDNLIYLAF